MQVPTTFSPSRLRWTRPAQRRVEQITPARMFASWWEAMLLIAAVFMPLLLAAVLIEVTARRESRRDRRGRDRLR